MVEKISDPGAAYVDVKAAHQWVTRELQLTTDPMRVFNLTKERKRLADIAFRLKRL